MRIAVVQLGYGDGESVADRTSRAVGLVGQAATDGADVVVLPELWPMGGFDYRAWEEKAETTDGPVAQALAAAAREHGITLHGGSIVEKLAAPGTFGNDLANTSLLFNPDGDLVASYRKIHRFGFAQGEPALMEPGETLVTAPVGAYTAGLSTCYDLRFPELYRDQIDSGATMFIIPAAWPMARVTHWFLLLRARAIEDQCVVVAANTAGTHAGVEMGGNSAIIGPTGDVLASAGAGEEIIAAEVADDLVSRAREAFPVLADRRGWATP